MKNILPILLFLHGAIHSIGFQKAYELPFIENLTASVSNTYGIFWFLTFVLFLVVGITHLAKLDWWYILAFVAVICSSILIISVWEEAKFGMIPNVVILIFAIVGYFTSNFCKQYKKDVKAGLKQTNTQTESVLTEADIRNLPLLVQKYIRYTGSLGKPKVANYHMEFVGKIRKNEKSEWMPFTTSQYNFVAAVSRLFFMKAVMKYLPVAGYHCFKNGKAFMDIRLLSFIKIQYQSGKEMDIAETVTFFNDICVMAPAALIDNRIKWIEKDEKSVKAVFTNKDITITAELYFNELGELINFVSEDRFAVSDKGIMQEIPWSTPITDYTVVDGYRLATYAEMIYKYPEGDFCYGKFSLSHIDYNCKKIKNF